eukprot:132159_1
MNSIFGVSTADDAENEANDTSESQIIFCIDISGLMCVSQKIDSNHLQKGHEDLSAFIDHNARHLIGLNQQVAYHKYMRKQQQTNAKEFAFSTLSPVNSKDMNGGVPPHYPSPHNYHNNNNTATSILSINEDNRTLTSTYSFGANGGTHMHHSNTHKNTHLYHQYRGTNSNNTLFNPDLSSGDNSSDYYTAITAASHAQTYHHHPSNSNPFGRKNAVNAGGELSHQDHRYHPQYHQHKKHRGKTKGP